MRQSFPYVFHEDRPVLLADPHASMRNGHAAAGVVHRSAGARREKVDQQLFFALNPVFATMLPESAQLLIRAQSAQ